MSPGSTALDPTALPHWARVALAAQLVRLLLPSFVQAWPRVAPARVQPILRAVALAEQSAAAAKPAEGLSEAMIDAIEVAGAATLPMYGQRAEDPLPMSRRNCLTATFVAKTAEFAVKCALVPAAESSAAILEAWSYAHSAVARDRKTQATLDRELRRYLAAAGARCWTDETPVGPLTAG